MSKPSWTGKKANVFYTKPEGPAFLQRFKEQVGYKEDSGLSNKFDVMPEATEEDVRDEDDELPQIVQLKPGDLSADDFKEIVSSTTTIKDGEITDKPIFQKPKRPCPSELRTSSKKKKTDETSKIDDIKDKSSKSVKKKEKSNAKLLSFDFDDDVEDS